MAPGDGSEGELIDRATAGDAEAFAGLYDRYLDRIYRYMALRVPTRDEAEDLTQQTFFQAWRAIGRYRRTAAPFAAWLMRIAHNLLVTYYRRSHRDAELHPDMPLTAPVSESPDRQVIHMSQQELLADALSRLSPIDRQVIVMRFVEGATHAEIAHILGRKVGSVRVRQHRALARLRAVLDGGAVPREDL